LASSEKKNTDLIKKIGMRNRKEKSKWSRESKERIGALVMNEKGMKAKIDSLEWNLNSIIGKLMDIKKYYVLKRFENLGNGFDKANRILKVRIGDIILVEDPSIISDKTLKILREKVTVIIGRKKFPRKLKEHDFLLIDSKKFSLKDFKHFSLVLRKEYDKELNKYELLKKIVKDYQKKRN